MFLTTISFGAESEECPAPQKLPKSIQEKSHKLSALDHLCVAREQLEAAGLTEEAVKLRELSDQFNRRICRERTELARQVTELQLQSEKLRQLTGRPDQILCRCSFLELSSEAAAEFSASAEPVKSTSGPRSHSNRGVSVDRNAEEAIEQLKKTGRVNGLTIPGLTVRRINTQAELNLGETLVVRTVSSTGNPSQVVNAKSDTASLEETVTLFMVTPVTVD